MLKTDAIQDLLALVLCLGLTSSTKDGLAAQQLIIDGAAEVFKADTCPGGSPP